MSLKVLVAEDDSNIANLVRLYLSKEGYFVLLAKDGQEALEIYQSQQPTKVVSVAKQKAHASPVAAAKALATTKAKAKKSVKHRHKAVNPVKK